MYNNKMIISKSSFTGGETTTSDVASISLLRTIPRVEHGPLRHPLATYNELVPKECFNIRVTFLGMMINHRCGICCKTCLPR